MLIVSETSYENDEVKLIGLEIEILYSKAKEELIGLEIEKLISDDEEERGYFEPNYFS